MRCICCRRLTQSDQAVAHGLIADRRNSRLLFRHKYEASSAYRGLLSTIGNAQHFLADPSVLAPLGARNRISDIERWTIDQFLHLTRLRPSDGSGSERNGGGERRDDELG